MPEKLRIDPERDLTDEGAELIRPVLEDIAQLEQRWVRDGDEGAYEQWRKLLSIASAIVAEHYIGPNELPAHSKFSTDA